LTGFIVILINFSSLRSSISLERLPSSTPTYNRQHTSV